MIGHIDIARETTLLAVKANTDLIPNLVASNLAYEATVTTFTDATHFKSTGLIGLGDNFFYSSTTEPWSVYPVWKATGTGGAPQGECQPVAAFTSADGTVQHTAFTVNLAVDDKVLLLHPAVVNMLGLTATSVGYLNNLSGGAVALDTGVGTVFSIVKSVLQSTIVAGGIDLTSVSSGGKLELIGAYIQNGATAFASGTSTAVAEIYTNNVRGSASFFTMSIVGGLLGTANSIVSEKNATSWTGVVLESGKKVSLKATTENFTSGGTADFYLIFRRLAAGATVAAA